MSMTKEEAIRWLEETLADTDTYWTSCSEALQKELDEQRQCFEIALSALRPVSREQVEKMPTLTPPNEPLTLISMSDEIPPDNERVLVYRPCMVDSDTGPYSVQWGWAAKRDGSHWARLPDRRPPEGEEDT